MNCSSHLRAVAFALSLIGALACTSVSAERLVDPTRPADAKVATQVRQNPLKLEAVMSSGASRVAIVNGRLVHVGDRVGAAQISEIFAHGIRYTLNGRSHELHLKTHALRVRNDAAPEDET
jgi:hypothetical protein